MTDATEEQASEQVRAKTQLEEVLSWMLDRLCLLGDMNIRW